MMPAATGPNAIVFGSGRIRIGQMVKAGLLINFLAWATILIVGHIMAPLMHVVYFSWRPEPLVMFTVFTIGCLASSLYLLPRMKGIVIAYQWARRMHGFGKDTPAAKGQ